MSSYKCTHCEKSYAYIENMNRHIRSVHDKQKFYCDKCNHGFSRLTSLKSHYDTVGGQQRCRLNLNRTKAIRATSTASTSLPTAATGASLATTSTTPTITSLASPSSATTATGASPATTSGSPPHLPVTPSTFTQSTPSATATTSETYCTACKVHIRHNHWSYHLRTNVHKHNSGMIDENNTNNNYNIQTIKSVFKQRIETLLIENKNEAELRTEMFLQNIQISLLEIIKNMVTKHGSIKWNIELFCDYMKIIKRSNDINNTDDDDDDEFHIEMKSHQTKMRPAFSSSDVESDYSEMCTDILAKMSEFQERDSGWTLIKIRYLEVNINQYKPLVGGTYIPLPREFLRRKACVNVQNSDDYCFKWAIISSLLTVSHSDRCSSYGVANIRSDVITLNTSTSINNNNISNNNIILDFSDLAFPLSIKDIPLFEKKNPQISVNVFGYEWEWKKIVGPYHITKEECIHHVNLLLLQQNNRSHYVWIKNLSR